jgi:hypothetical protein
MSAAQGPVMPAGSAFASAWEKLSPGFSRRYQCIEYQGGVVELKIVVCVRIAAKRLVIAI